MTNTLSKDFNVKTEQLPNPDGGIQEFSNGILQHQQDW